MRQAKNKNTLTRLRIPKRKLPKAWTRALGLLKHKKIDGLAYQKKIRAEWDDRMKGQIRLARSGGPLFVYTFPSPLNSKK